MTMAEYAAMDMQWYEEAKTAISHYRQGQQAAKQIEQTRAGMRAG